MSEYTFTTHHETISFDKFNEPITLVFFSDVHRFADNCDVNRWHQFLDRCKQLEKQGPVYYIGVGDYDDFASTSERRSLKNSGLHDTTLRSLDDLARVNTEKFIEEISFMKDKLIGLVEGNHHYQFSSGITSTQLMCETLSCKYLGWMSAIRLSFHKTNDTRVFAVDIAAHHGRGGGKRTGSSINNVEDLMRVIDANIYVMGHDHKKWIVDSSKLYITNTINGVHVKQRDIILGRTGSYQLGYIPGKSSYPAQLAMPPSKRGSIYVSVIPRNKNDDNTRKFGFELSGGLL